MSRLSTTTSAGTGNAIVSLDARGLEVISQLGYMPSAVAGALRIRVLDLVAHHRASVGKKVAADFPGGRRAQKFWFGRSFQFTNKSGASIARVGGESFAVGIDGARGSGELWRVLENGGLIRAKRGFFIIPFNLQGGGKRSFAGRFGKAGAGEFDITPSGLVIREAGKVGQRGGRSAFKTQVLGTLRRTRKQRKLLKFFATVDEILPRHLPAMNKVFDQALTVTGRDALAGQTRAMENRLIERLSRGRPGGDSVVAKTAEKLAAVIRLTPGARASS